MRELPILTNCGVNSFSSSALFKFRDRRFSVRIRGISSCRERAMLLSFTSWLHWMPNSTGDTNPASGFDRPSQSSEENFVNCTLSLDRILLSCMGDASWWLGFLVKTLLPRISSPPPSQSRQTTDLSMVRHSVFQILGKLLLENALRRGQVPLEFKCLPLVSLHQLEESYNSPFSSQVGGGIIERTLNFSAISGLVQLEETPLDGTLVVFNGTVPVSVALYSVVSNLITFTGAQTGIMIRYQTSAFARAGLPARKNFYSPYLFEVRFEWL